MKTLLHTWANPTWEDPTHKTAATKGLSLTYGANPRFLEVEIGDTIIVARNKDGMLWVGGKVIRYGPIDNVMDYHYPTPWKKTRSYYVRCEPGHESDLKLVPVGKKVLRSIRYIGADGHKHPLALDSNGKLTRMSTANPLWLTESSAQKLLTFTS